MTVEKPDVRVLIDWNGNGFINRDYRLGQPPNLFPDAPDLLPRYAGLSGTPDVPQVLLSARRAAETEEDRRYGNYYIRYLRNNITTNNFNFFFGLDKFMGSGGELLYYKGSPTFPYTGNFRFTFWVRGVSADNQMSFQCFASTDTVFNPLAVGTVSSSVVIAPVTSEWSRVAITLPNFLTTNHSFVMSIRAVTPAVFNYRVDLTGFMLTLTGNDAPLFYNDGQLINETIGSDQIAEVSWNNGMSDRMDRVTNEGSATVVLYNDGRFMPDLGVNVPKPTSKMHIQVKDITTDQWFNVWSGYVESFKPIVGKPNERRAEISAVTGIFWAANKSNVNVTKIGTRTATVFGELFDMSRQLTPVKILQQLVSMNSWQPPTSPVGFKLGNSKLGTQTALINSTNYIARLPVNIPNTPIIPYVGWNIWEELSYPDALKAFAMSMWYLVFTDKDGRLTIYDDVASLPSVSVFLDTQVQDAEYSYGLNFYDRVVVPYRDTYTGAADLIVKEDQPLEDVDEETQPSVRWGKKTNIPVASLKAFKRELTHFAVWDFEPPQGVRNDYDNADYNDWVKNFEAPEWATFYPYDRTTMIVNSIFPSENFNFELPVRQTSVIEEASSPAGTYIWSGAPIVPTWWRQREDDTFRIRFTNRTGLAGYSINVRRLTANVTMFLEDEETEASAIDANQLELTKTFKIDKTLWFTKARADQLAALILAERNTMVGEWNSITVMNRDLQSREWLETWGVGTVLSVTESFSGTNNVRHIIIGEDHTITQETWTARYTLMRATNGLMS